MSEARTAELPGAAKGAPLSAATLWRKPARGQALPVFAGLAVLVIAFLSLALPRGRASVLLLDLPSQHFFYPFTIQNVMHIVFFLGLGELFVRWRIAAREKRFLSKGFLPEDDQTVLGPEDLGPIRRKVAGQFDHEHGFLPSLINMAVLQFQSSSSVEQAAGIMNQHLELISHRVDLRYGLVRFIAWLVPTLGFIGTVFSLGASLAGAGVPGKPLDLKDVARTLGIGFDCTMVALMESAILVFILHLVQEKEESALDHAGDYTLRNLINRLYAGELRHSHEGAPREVNIFNMSLLDILCGALGAFCFMMLVALPYYTTGSDKERQQNKESIAILLKDVETLRQRMTDPAMAEELRQLIDRLEAQIKLLEGQVNHLAYENEKLKQDNEAAAKALNDTIEENEKLVGENEKLKEENVLAKLNLATKKAFAVMATTIEMRQDLDLYLQDMPSAGGSTSRANRNFDPNQPFHRSGEYGDLNIFGRGRGTVIWVSSTTAPRFGYRLFVKYGGRKVLDRDTVIQLSFFGSFAQDQATPEVRLTNERPWILAGMITTDDKGGLAFREATAAERDDAWREITKTEPPSATAAPATPTPRPQGGITQEEKDRMRKQGEEERKKYEELRRQKQSGDGAQSPAGGPTPERGSDAAARALREREARSPAPASSPPPATPQP